MKQKSMRIFCSYERPSLQWTNVEVEVGYLESNGMIDNMLDRDGNWD